MTVKDLRESLSKLDDNLITMVEITDDNGTELFEVEGAYRSNPEDSKKMYGVGNYFCDKDAVVKSLPDTFVLVI